MLCCNCSSAAALLLPRNQKNKTRRVNLDTYRGRQPGAYSPRIIAANFFRYFFLFLPPLAFGLGAGFFLAGAGAAGVPADAGCSGAGPPTEGISGA